jgi:serine/threonine protein phosphatase 1
LEDRRFHEHEFGRSLWTNDAVSIISMAMPHRLQRASKSAPVHYRTAVLPRGLRAYVIGDVHGMSDLLNDVFRRIDADVANSAPACVVEIILGDLVDRGPDSAKVLGAVMARKQETALVCLAGNHEIYMIEALARQDAFQAWMKVGGDATVRSFGVVPPPATELAEAHRAFSAAVPRAYRRFLHTLQPMHCLGDYLFVHAGVLPGVPLAQQSMADLTMIRTPFLTSELAHGYVVVHGHSPTQQVDFRKNRINLDTGAYRSGVLSCIVIEGSTVRHL